MAREGSLRLTGLFATRRKGMWTGTLRTEEIEKLADLSNQAATDGKTLTLILFENDRPESKNEFSVYIGESRDRGASPQPTPAPVPAYNPAPARTQRRTSEAAKPSSGRLRRAEPAAEDPDRLPF